MTQKSILTAKLVSLPYFQQFFQDIWKRFVYCWILVLLQTRQQESLLPDMCPLIGNTERKPFIGYLVEWINPRPE